MERFGDDWKIDEMIGEEVIKIKGKFIK